MKNVDEHVASLIQKAATSEESGDAMRFAQAAENAARAAITMSNIVEKEPGAS